jgi:tetratricopeptide (TPR) repeat protein
MNNNMEEIDNDGIIRRLHSFYPIPIKEDEQLLINICSCINYANSIFDQDTEEAIKNYYYVLSFNYQRWKYPIDFFSIVHPIPFISGINIPNILCKMGDNCIKTEHRDLSIWAYCLAYLCDEDKNSYKEKILEVTHYQNTHIPDRLIENLIEFFSLQPENENNYYLEVEFLTEFWNFHEKTFFFTTSPILWAQHLTGVLSNQSIAQLVDFFVEAGDALSVAALLATITVYSDKHQVPELVLSHLLNNKGGNQLSITFLETVTNHKPDNPLLWEELGKLYESEKRFSESIDAYSEAINYSTISPTCLDRIPILKLNSRLNEKIGDLSLFVDRYEDALESYRYSLENIESAILRTSHQSPEIIEKLLERKKRIFKKILDLLISNFNLELITQICEENSQFEDFFFNQTLKPEFWDQYTKYYLNNAVYIDRHLVGILQKIPDNKIALKEEVIKKLIDTPPVEFSQIIIMFVEYVKILDFKVFFKIFLDIIKEKDFSIFELSTLIIEIHKITPKILCEESVQEIMRLEVLSSEELLDLSQYIGNNIGTDQVLLFFNNLLSSDIQNADFWYRLGKNLCKLKKFQPALVAFNKFLPLVSSDKEFFNRKDIFLPYEKYVTFWWKLGLFYLNNEKMVESREAFNWMFDSTSRDADLWLKMYYDLKEINLLDLAEQAYQRFLSLLSLTSTDRIFAYAKRFNSTNEFDKRLDCFRILLTKKSLPPQIIEVMITHFQKSQLLKERDIIINKTLHNEGYTSEELVSIGRLLDSLGNKEHVHEFYQKAYNKEKGVLDFVYVELFCKMGREDLAIKVIKNIKKIEYYDFNQILSFLKLLDGESNELLAMILLVKWMENKQICRYIRNVDDLSAICEGLHREKMNRFLSLVYIYTFNQQECDNKMYADILTQVKNEPTINPLYIQYIVENNVIQITDFNLGIIYIIKNSIKEGIQFLKKSIHENPELSNCQTFFLLNIFKILNFDISKINKLCPEFLELIKYWINIEESDNNLDLIIETYSCCIIGYNPIINEIVNLLNQSLNEYRDGVNNNLENIII